MVGEEVADVRFGAAGPEGLDERLVRFGAGRAAGPRRAGDRIEVPGVGQVESGAVTERVPGGDREEDLLALVMLAPAARWEVRRAGSRPARYLALDAGAGGLLGADLVLWAAGVLSVGAWVATVLLNVQVLVFPLLARLVTGTRLPGRFLPTVPVLLAGVAPAGGALGRPRPGSAPVAGVAFGTAAGVAYAGYLFLMRLGAAAGTAGRAAVRREPATGRTARPPPRGTVPDMADSRRADMRLTTPSFLVLGFIDQLGEASPYDVKVEAARTVAPFWSMPHAQVYAQCDRLVEAGLLSESRQTGGRNRRLLRLTPAGRAALAEWLADSSFVPVEARERSILKLWFGARPEVHSPVQIDEHRRTLAAYEELADEVGELLSRGQREALEFGIRYERMMVDFWQWVEQRGA